MNQEEQIKQRLAIIRDENIDPQYSGLTEDPQKSEAEETDTSSNNLPLDNMLLKQQVFDLLQVSPFTRSSTESQNYVETIARWATENTSTNELADVLKTIQQQIRGMGWQLKADKIQKLYRYVKLNSQRVAIETQMGALYG